jgi:hypothetical protein
VRQQDVLEVERAVDLPIDRAEPLLEAGGPAAAAELVEDLVPAMGSIAVRGGRLCIVELAQGLVDRRQLPLERLRCDLVEVDEAGIVEDRGTARTLLMAQLHGAEIGRLLPHLHPVRLAEQREQVVRVLGRDRQRLLVPHVARHQPGHDARRLIGRSREVPVVGAVLGQRGEVRVQLHIDLVVLVEQRCSGELVEAEEHHGHMTPNRNIRRSGIAGEDDLVRGRVEQEQQQHKRRQG